MYLYSHLSTKIHGFPSLLVQPLLWLAVIHTEQYFTAQSILIMDVNSYTIIYRLYTYASSFFHLPQKTGHLFNYPVQIIFRESLHKFNFHCDQKQLFKLKLIKLCKYILIWVIIFFVFKVMYHYLVWSFQFSGQSHIISQFWDEKIFSKIYWILTFCNK